MITPSTKMLTIDEVCGELGVVRSTVEDWVRGKELSSCRLGKKCVRIPLVGLMEFVAKKTLQPRKPDWLTPEVESKFEQKIEGIVERKFNALKTAA